MTSRMLVGFDGEGAGAGELTWAQLGIWQTMVRTGLSMNIGGVVAVPPGTTPDEMARLLRYLVSRHPALRTRLRLRPDARPEQVVSAAGEVPLDIVDDESPDELLRRYESAPFDHEHEWPVRMGVVCRDGAVTHVVIAYCHLAVDGFGIDALVRDMPNMDPATGEPTAPPPGLTPLDMAQRQRTPSDLRQSQKSLRYWERLLRSIPTDRFGGLGEPQEPRYREFVLRSPALHNAVRTVADRTGVGSGYVLLAAYAVALARLTGSPTSVAQLVVNNRFRPGFADAVSQSTQLGLCVIDVPDPAGDLDEVVVRGFNAATNAFMHGYYDPLAHNDLLARVAADRGEVDIAVIVNDRSRFPAEVSATPGPTETRWGEQADALDAGLNISFDSTDDAVEVTVRADTHRLSPKSIESLAREIEAVTLEAAAQRS
ncbi:condensation domain-containing protein [Dactylosporangium sucinum]|nr:condensation domain-containing protein [Dactylosporangium sucinum]